MGSLMDFYIFLGETFERREEVTHVHFAQNMPRACSKFAKNVTKSYPVNKIPLFPLESAEHRRSLCSTNFRVIAHSWF